jgi:outer membrane protein assembly factor BamB
MRTAQRLLAAAALAALAPLPAAADGEDWRESDPGLDILVDQVSVLPFKDWKHFTLPDETITRVTLLADHLFVETLSNRIYAVDRMDGFVKWLFEIDTKAPLDFPPTIAHGLPEERRQLEDDLVKLRTRLEDEKKAKNRDMNKLRELMTRRQEVQEKHKVLLDRDNFYCLSKGVLFCLHRTGGQFFWSRDLAKLTLPIIASAPPYATRAHVFVADVRLDRLYPVEVARQDAMIHMPAGDEILGQPIYEDPSVYFTSKDGFAYCYNVNGQLTWRYKTEKPVKAGAAIGKRIDKRQGREQLEKTCYVGGTDYALYALDADTGALRWKYETGAVIETPAVAVGETVYQKTEQGGLLALNVKPVHRTEKGEVLGERRNGELRWRYPLGERFVVKTKTRVYILGPGRELVGMDETSGTIKSRHSLSLFPYVLTNTGDDILYLIHPAGHIFRCQESKTEF